MSVHKHINRKERILAALRECLAKSTGFGSYVQLQRWLKEIHGVSIRYKTLLTNSEVYRMIIMVSSSVVILAGSLSGKLLSAKEIEGKLYGYI